MTLPAKFQDRPAFELVSTMAFVIWLPAALLMRVTQGVAVGAAHDVPVHRGR